MLWCRLLRQHKNCRRYVDADFQDAVVIVLLAFLPIMAAITSIMDKSRRAPL